MSQRCWTGAKIEMPNGQDMSWRCYSAASKAIKVRQESLVAWGKIGMEVGYTPVCEEHFREAEKNVEDWQTIEEWEQWQRRARSGRA